MNSKITDLKYILIITILMLVTYNNILYSDIKYHIFNPLEVTIERKNKNLILLPKKFNKTNNLIKKTGSFYKAIGEVIIIRGKITDIFGTPIDSAIVKIWHKNAAGKYQNLLKKNSKLIDPNFSGSGTSISDNLGNYKFITIFPGSEANETPVINIDIIHKKFGKLETIIFFPNHPKNIIDYRYLSYTEKERNILTAKIEREDLFNVNSIKIITFNIVMKGVHQYKSFKK